jgi:hypothetical protein
MSGFIYQPSSSKRATRRWEGDCSDETFLSLMRDLRAHGGIIPVEDIRVITSVFDHGGNITQLLSQNMLFFIIWRRQHWMPCFQFNPETWLPCPAVASIVQVLRPAMGGAELAIWFKSKALFLRGKSPLELLQTDVERVHLYASHSCRTSIARGTEAS